MSDPTPPEAREDPSAPQGPVGASRSQSIVLTSFDLLTPFDLTDRFCRDGPVSAPAWGQPGSRSTRRPADHYVPARPRRGPIRCREATLTVNPGPANLRGSCGLGGGDGL